MADEIIKTALLDRHMKEAFDWSDYHEDGRRYASIFERLRR